MIQLDEKTFAKVIFSYYASEENQLNLKRGQFIHVREKTTHNWWLVI